MNEQISILVTGDFYGGGRIDALISAEKYGEIFNDFMPAVREADLAITNLESPLLDEGTAIDKTGPAIKSSPGVVKALDYAGFALLTLANNHLMDYGGQGLQNTIKLCELNGIDHVGAGMNYAEASDPWYREIKGKKLAVLNFTENEFSTTHDDLPGCNPIDPVGNYYKIKEAADKADFVVVIVHGGHETYNLPSPRMKKLYRFYADAGASAIVGHHTHCYSGYEIYNKVPIFYSLGNFIFDKPGNTSKKWKLGYAVKLELSHKVDFSIIPYEQCGQSPGLTLLDKDSFKEDIERRNAIIGEDELLKGEFETFCGKSEKMYLSYLEPHSIRILHFLRNRGLLPSVLSKRKKLLYLNLMRCESHRDVLLSVLNKKT